VGGLAKFKWPETSSRAKSVRQMGDGLVGHTLMCSNGDLVQSEWTHSFAFGYLR